MQLNLFFIKGFAYNEQSDELYCTSGRNIVAASVNDTTKPLRPLFDFNSIRKLLYMKYDSKLNALFVSSLNSVFACFLSEASQNSCYILRENLRSARGLYLDSEKRALYIVDHKRKQIERVELADNLLDKLKQVEQVPIHFKIVLNSETLPGLGDIFYMTLFGDFLIWTEFSGKVKYTNVEKSDNFEIMFNSNEYTYAIAIMDNSTNVKNDVTLAEFYSGESDEDYPMEYLQQQTTSTPTDDQTVSGDSDLASEPILTTSTTIIQENLSSSTPFIEVGNTTTGPILKALYPTSSITIDAETAEPTSKFMQTSITTTQTSNTITEDSYASEEDFTESEPTTTIATVKTSVTSIMTKPSEVVTTQKLSLKTESPFVESVVIEKPETNTISLETTTKPVKTSHIQINHKKQTHHRKNHENHDKASNFSNGAALESQSTSNDQFISLNLAFYVITGFLFLSLIVNVILLYISKVRKGRGKFEISGEESVENADLKKLQSDCNTITD